jgi:hypothetical protein
MRRVRNLSESRSSRSPSRVVAFVGTEARRSSRFAPRSSFRWMVARRSAKERSFAERRATMGPQTSRASGNALEHAPRPALIGETSRFPASFRHRWKRDLTFIAEVDNLVEDFGRITSRRGIARLDRRVAALA